MHFDDFAELIVLDVSILTRATVVRARFLAAAFSDGSYLAHVNGAYLRHVTFCIVRGPPLFIVSPISQRGPASVRGPLTVPGWSKVHDGDFEGVEQSVESNTTCVPYFSRRNVMSRFV